MKWYDVMMLHRQLDTKRAFSIFGVEDEEITAFVVDARRIWDSSFYGVPYGNTVYVSMNPPYVGDDGIGEVEVRGIDGIRRFHSDYLEENRKNIGDLLGRMQVPGRWLSKVYGKDFNFLEVAKQSPPYLYWELVVSMKMGYMLGLAIGRVREVAPREFWDTLPGGMPYYVVDE